MDNTLTITLRRDASNSYETIGTLYYDKLSCRTLEDEHRAIKVRKETRIPAGKYEIKLRTVGTHAVKYLKKYPAFHKGMFWLQNVPGFQYILIHIGNTDKDTEGCILVNSDIVTKNGRYVGTGSTLAYVAMYKKIVPYFAKGYKVFIEIVDEPRQDNG